MNKTPPLIENKNENKNKTMIKGKSNTNDNFNTIETIEECTSASETVNTNTGSEFSESESGMESSTDVKYPHSVMNNKLKGYDLSTFNNHNHVPGVRFRYIIHGIPKNRYYTVEEARWSWKRKSFVSEHIHSMTPNSVKIWVGYSPKDLGLSEITMWLFLPYYIFPDKIQSPVKIWETNKDAFAPFSFEKLRYNPESCSQNVYDQASKFPPSFQSNKLCEACVYKPK